MKQYLNSNSIAFALANLSQVVFEVTDNCNLKCKYCAYGEYYEDYDMRENKVLPVEKAIRLIDYLAEFWNSGMSASSNQTMFISFYGGEPLLNMPFIRSVVDYIENNLYCPGRRFIFSMTTNALLLHKYMDFLHRHDFSILISLDGNKDNMEYRVDKAGNSSFERIINNVNVLKGKYPDYFNRRVNFNAVLHNKNSVEEIHTFFKQNYNKDANISELNNVGIRKDKQNEFNEIYKNSTESLQQSEHYEEIEREMFIRTGSYQSASLFLYRYSGFVFNDYTDLLFDRSKQKSLPTGTCQPFSKKMFVTVNGKILPCERIGHQFALGEITDDRVILDAQAIADRYNAYYAKFENQCGKCKNIKSCIQCIFNISDLDNKPVCHGYMNEEAFQDYVNTQMRFLEKNPEAYRKIMEKVLLV